MSIQPVQSVTQVPVGLVAGSVPLGNLIDPTRSLGEQAAALLLQVQANVARETVNLGESPESRRAYLATLKARREEARAEQHARQREAEADAYVREKQREAAQIEEENNPNRLNYTASELRKMQETAQRLNLIG